FTNVNYLHLTWFSPFPTEQVKNILEKSKKVLAIEQNYSGQMCRLIREKTGIEIANKLLKYDGRMFYREEIIDKIKELI
ncbi:MAG: 2-oxoacid:acceptor oxidoreductase subunit alpha, partial [bacterium]|nr:2-oxoacid:acceptor oxidoreductase subunit alpha [bacterium]